MAGAWIHAGWLELLSITLYFYGGEDSLGEADRSTE
jgi:hypothetical protein